MKLMPYLLFPVIYLTILFSNENVEYNTKNCPSCKNTSITDKDKSFVCDDKLFDINHNDEVTLIKETLQKYIDGTSKGQPNKLHDAFHKDLNLYSVNQDGSLKIWKGSDYIKIFKEGKVFNRKGEILSIDHENNIATAKVRITTPSKSYMDYFMLLKLNDNWKIIHKSYTVQIN